MDHLELTLPTLAANLALDEALLLDAEAESTPHQLLRIWEWPSTAVVLGAAGILQDDVDEAACVAAGVPIARRSSGGGTVLLGDGCLLYSLVLPYTLAPALTDVTASYRWILAKMCAGLATVQPGLAWAGTSDLVVAGRKCSGNAQQRKRCHLLHHGSLLYAFELALLGRYLREPKRRPDYREQRVHGEFVCNLAASREHLIAALRATWGAERSVQAWPRAETERLCRERYERTEWIRRR